MGSSRLKTNYCPSTPAGILTFIASYVVETTSTFIGNEFDDMDIEKRVLGHDDGNPRPEIVASPP